MLKEIGSEFWNEGPVRRDRVYLLSGRTALDYIIRDILKHYNVKSALLPSYCCHTMIEPFFRHGISVRFYDVYFDDIEGLSVDVPKVREDEIFYFMTYFGFCRLSGLDLKNIRRDAAVTIEDMTHSWLSGNSGSDADYAYVSYRKWTGFDAVSLAVKENGVFSEIPDAVNTEYTAMRKQAFAMKREYMETGAGEKQDFLGLFEKAEELLATDYVGYAPTAETMSALLRLDTAFIAERRRANAKILIDGLKDIPEIKSVFSAVMEDEVPLFVPVLISKNRTELRKYLIDNEIYCPIHWPKSAYHEGIGSMAERLYGEELSLVCDQRYGTDEMKRIVELIGQYYKR